MPGRKSTMVGPRCSGWKKRMGSRALGQPRDPEMKIEGKWFTWEVQRHLPKWCQQQTGKVTQEGKASSKRWLLSQLSQWVGEV